MKALLQRVSKASVTVDGEVVGAIGPGLAVLVGVASGDSIKEARSLAERTVRLRIFPDECGKFNLSLLDTQGEMLVVSQFTLLADTHKGRRPSFIDAAPPALAQQLIDEFITAAREFGVKTAEGRFQAHMLVEIHNDGPVTIMLDSKDKPASQN